jgi:HemY protein
VRLLLAFLVLAAAAVTVALLARINAGYALFVAPPYRVELSLNTFFVLVLLAFVAIYVVLRMYSRLARMPGEVRASRPVILPTTR